MTLAHPRLQQIFAPPTFPDDDEKNRIASLLNYTLWTAAIVHVPLLMGAYLGNSPLPNIFITALSMVVMLGLHIPLRRGYVKLTSMLLVTWAVLGITLILGFFGTARTVALVYFILIIVIAELLIGRWGTMLTTVMVSASFLGLIYAETRGLLPAPNPQVTWTNVFSFLVAAFLTGRLLNLATRSIDQALAQAQQELAERQRIEQFLMASESRYRLLTELMSDIAYYYAYVPGVGFVAEWVAGSIERLTGYSLEVLMAYPQQVFHPDELERLEMEVRQTHEGISTNSEYRWVRRDGTIMWVQVRREPVWDAEHQKVIGFYGLTHDITERKHTELALRESEERYRFVSETISDYAYAYDIHPDGTFSSAWITEDSFTRLTGYAWDEIGTSYKLYHPEDVPKVKEHVSQTLQGKATSGVYRIITRSGDIRWIQIRRSLKWDQNQRPIRFFWGDTGYYGTNTGGNCPSRE